MQRIPHFLAMQKSLFQDVLLLQTILDVESVTGPSPRYLIPLHRNRSGEGDRLFGFLFLLYTLFPSSRKGFTSGIGKKEIGRRRIIILGCHGTTLQPVHLK